MENDVIITGFSNSTSEGVTLHLNTKTTLKTGNVKNSQFWVSWDKIGKPLFDNYTDETSVEARNELRNNKDIDWNKIREEETDFQKRYKG